MTSIDSLRSELAEYHVEVREHIVRSEAREKAFRDLQVDVYGVPGEKKMHPGLMGEVASLRRSRRVIQIVFGGVWTITTLIFGAILATLTGR